MSGNFFIAKDLEQVLQAFELNFGHCLAAARAEKGYQAKRKEGEAYAWEQAAKMLRELKWAKDVARDGSAAPYAITRHPPKKEPGA